MGIRIRVLTFFMLRKLKLKLKKWLIGYWKVRVEIINVKKIS